MEALLRQVMRGTAVRLCTVVWAFGYVLVDLAAAVQGRAFPGVMFVANIPLLLLGIVQSIALGLLYDRTARAPALMHWTVTGLAGLGAAIVQTIANHYLLGAIALTLLPDWQEWALDLQPARTFAILIVYLWTLYLTVALMWASRTADSSKLNMARAAASSAAASRAEAAALRLQLNPHFLFNTLNGISSLVVRNERDQAEEMIGQLADFLRSSLAADPMALISLDQEVAIVRAYLAIEQARFGPRLTVEYNIESDLARFEVPNFILQPLVENAIQHGIAAVPGPVTINIQARRTEEGLMLSVVNHCAHGDASAMSVGRSASAGGHGIGLTNTRARLASQYGGRAWLECGPMNDGYGVDICFPDTAFALRDCTSNR